MMNAYMKMSNEELMLAVGGRRGKKGLCEGPIRTVHGLQSGWLALRSEPRYDYRNEIGQLYNGDEVLRGKLRAAETAAYFRRYSLPDCACGHQTAHNHYDERCASVTC